MKSIATPDGDARLRVGEWVEVLSKEEILATLDHQGQLDGLPFMPEMFVHCGRRLSVSKRAHKTCDPSLGMVGRKMRDAVHLEGVRCDGQAHDGCEAGCLIFWKTAWLRRVDPEADIVAGASHRAGPAQSVPTRVGCTEAQVLACAKMPASEGSEDINYVCQNTHLKHATHPLHWWDPRQYLEDLSSGNAKVSQLIAALLFFFYHGLASVGLGFGSAMRWAYDAFQQLRGGTPYPWRAGRVAKGAPTPSLKLNLQPGEVVRVKPYAEILETLDENSRNRGMYFDGEMVPYTGHTFRVVKRVRQIIDEKTSRMVRFKTDAIMLEGVACQARYSKCRRFCPRAIIPYWREIWLERGANALPTPEDGESA